MRAELLSVGTELLLGQILDTNANYLAQQLPSLGIDLYYVSAIGDNLERLADAFRVGLKRSDLIISSGGLGPTEDDLTREAISAALDEPMAVEPELEKQLRDLFARRGRTMPERNVKQATLVRSALPLLNPVGTAPGWWVERDGKVIISMPGVPHEMVKMWQEQALPRLAPRVGAAVLVSRTLKLIGIGESHAEEAVGELTRSTNPTLATYAKSDGVHLRLTAKAATNEEALKYLDDFEPRVRERVGEYVYGYEEDTFPSAVGQLLRQQRLTLAVAESATGGQIAGLVTDAAGSSEYFLGGVVAYARAAKEELGVPTSVLDGYGTIAPETTIALAAAVRQRFGADVAVATTGVAGPGPAENQPAGTLYTAVDIGGRAVCHTAQYATTRVEYKRRGALDALNLLWRELRTSGGGQAH